MEFFCLHRDRPGSLPLRQELRERHWAYMDGYAATMIARGPTTTDDGEIPTGSVHILDLPDPAAARAFAFEEPNYQAGVYRDVLLRRWRNDLGRTMWQFPEQQGDSGRYLVLGVGYDPEHGTGDSRQPASGPGVGLIAYGPLLSDDAHTTLGTAALVQAASAEMAGVVLDRTRYAAVEVHPWRFGGRP